MNEQFPKIEETWRCSKKACGWIGTDAQQAKVPIRSEKFEMQELRCPKCNNNSFYRVHTDQEKQQRVEKIRLLIEEIAATGRKFFRIEGRLAAIGFDEKGLLWWTDEWDQKRCCISRGKWSDWGNKIHHGSGLRMFIQYVRDFILKENHIPDSCFDHWGYESEIQKVIDRGYSLGIVTKKI